MCRSPDYSYSLISIKSSYWEQMIYLFSHKVYVKQSVDISSHEAFGQVTKNVQSQQYH